MMKQTREEQHQSPVSEQLAEAFADNEEWLAELDEGSVPVPEEDRPQDDPEGSQASGWPCYQRDPSAGSRDRHPAPCTRFRYVHPWTDTDL